MVKLSNICCQQGAVDEATEGAEGRTYRGKVVGSAGFPSVLAGQQHVVQLVAQSVHELQVGALKVPGGQKEPEIGELPEPGLSVLLEQVQNHRPDGAVGQQQAQPVAGEVQVALGELVEADGVVVADGDCRESQFLGPLCVDPRVRGEGKPVEEAVGGPGQKQSHGGTEGQQPEGPAAHRAPRDANIPQAMQTCP